MKPAILAAFLLAAAPVVAQIQPVKVVQFSPWDGKYPGASQPFFHDATVSNGYLYVAAGKGLQVVEGWSGISRGYWYAPSLLPSGTWLESDQKWYAFDVSTPPGEDDVVAMATSGNGLIVWDTSTKSPRTPHYQDAGAGEATGVYTRTVAGRDYAYVAVGDGMRVYDLTKAREYTGCRDLSGPGTICCPGVYLGRAGAGLTSKLDGAGKWIAASAASGWQLYDGTDPKSPQLVGVREPASDVAVTLAGGKTVVASVGGPLTLSSIGPTGAVSQITSWAAPTGASLVRVQASQAPFGPALWVAGSKGGAHYEALLDISTPSSPQVVGGEAYWAARRDDYNGKSAPPDFVTYGHGTWVGPWLYVASQELLDAHRLSGGGSPTKPPNDDEDTPTERLPSACDPPPPPGDDDDEPPPPPPPTGFQACFEVEAPVVAGEEATVKDCHTGDPLRYAYDWDGDGAFEMSSPQPVLSHVWVAAGQYRAALKLLAPGLRSTTYRDVVVTAGAEPIRVRCDCPGEVVSESSTGRSIVRLLGECECVEVSP